MTCKLHLLAAAMAAVALSPESVVVRAFSIIAPTSTTRASSLPRHRPHARVEPRLWASPSSDETSERDDSGDGGRAFVPESGDRTRRSFLIRTAASSAAAALALLPAFPHNAYAGIDPTALRALPVEGDANGAVSRLRQFETLPVEGDGSAVSRLRQIETTSDKGARPEDANNVAFEVLPNGASFREFREGKGDAVVGPGSKVAVEMTVRMKSFATANEPGGLKCYTTKEDTDFDELAWTLGKDDGNNPVPQELEEAMTGMKKGGLRRIEVPSTAVFAARKAGRLPLPSEKIKDRKRRFEEKLFKTDATLIFEVYVTRIK